MTRKQDFNGTLITKSDRVMIDGSQQPDLTFDQTWAPVPNINVVHFYFTIAVQMQLITHYVDVSNAFLNRIIEEAIYIYQPPCFYIAKPSNLKNPLKTIYKLKKSIYELRQSTRIWWQHINTEFKSMAFFSYKKYNQYLSKSSHFNR